MDEKLAADLMGAIKSGLHLAVKEKLNGYNSPLDRVLAGVFEKEAPALKEMLVSCVSSAVADEEFRQQIQSAVRSKLAKVLVERFGGELEKQVNTLKSDPATRARITLAIEEIIAAK